MFHVIIGSDWRSVIDCASDHRWLNATGTVAFVDSEWGSPNETVENTVLVDVNALRVGLGLWQHKPAFDISLQRTLAHAIAATSQRPVLVTDSDVRLATQLPARPTKKNVAVVGARILGRSSEDHVTVLRRGTFRPANPRISGGATVVLPHRHVDLIPYLPGYGETRIWALLAEVHDLQTAVDPHFAATHLDSAQDKSNDRLVEEQVGVLFFRSLCWARRCNPRHTVLDLCSVSGSTGNLGDLDPTIRLSQTDASERIVDLFQRTDWIEKIGRRADESKQRLVAWERDRSAFRRVAEDLLDGSTNRHGYP